MVQRPEIEFATTLLTTVPNSVTCLSPILSVSWFPRVMKFRPASYYLHLWAVLWNDYSVTRSCRELSSGSYCCPAFSSIFWDPDIVQLDTCGESTFASDNIKIILEFNKSWPWSSRPSICTFCSQLSPIFTISAAPDIAIEITLAFGVLKTTSSYYDLIFIYNWSMTSSYWPSGIS